MVSHLVLMKPRPDLTADERRALVAAFETATRNIPSVRRVRIGQRVLHGAGYEAVQPDLADYLITIEFEDLEGLKAYLNHPEHERLGRLFNDSLAAGGVYDFEMLSDDGVKRLV
jgi:hypothetical protein